MNAGFPFFGFAGAALPGAGDPPLHGAALDGDSLGLGNMLGDELELVSQH